MRAFLQFDEDNPELKEKMLFKIVGKIDVDTYELEQVDIIGNPRYSI